MAPMKFEENIKEKLGERTLEPSANAWETIASQLEQQDSKKKFNYKFWIAIAAVLLVGVFLFAGLFKSPVATPPSNVVETESESIKVKIKSPIQENIDVPTEAVVVVEPVILEPVDKIKAVPNTPSKKDRIKTEIVNVDKATVIEKTPNKSVVAINNPVVQETSETAILQQKIQEKVSELVAEVDKLKADNEAVSDAEIDALLAKAQRDILRDRAYNAQTRTVDASALLLDVELEMERSFRDKIFDALKDGFTKARDAVADRNN